MGKKTNPPSPEPVNDIWHCLEDAQVLADQITRTRYKDKRLVRAFTSLAQDESVGFLAYVIWKGRGQGLSNLRTG